jgi:hypothetical protein
MTNKELIEFNLEKITNEEEYNRAVIIIEAANPPLLDEESNQKIEHILKLLNDIFTTNKHIRLSPEF